MVSPETKSLLLSLSILFSISFFFCKNIEGQEFTNDTVNEQLKSLHSNKEKANLLIEYARNLQTIDPLKGIAFAKNSLGYAKNSGDNEILLQSINILASNYNNSGYSDSALSVLNSARYIVETIDNKNRFYYFNLLGRAFYGEHLNDSSLYYFKMGAKISVSLDDLDFKAASFNNLGLIYSEMGRLGDAYNSYMEAYKLYDSIGNKKTEAVTLNNIAVIDIELNQHEEAIHWLLKAIQINDSLGQFYVLSMNYANIGICLKELGRNEEALEALQKSVQIAKEQNMTQDVARGQMNLGNLYTRMNLFDKAMESYQSSLKICVDENIPYGIMLNKINLGELMIKKLDYKVGIKTLKQAEELAISMGQHKILADIYESMSTAYEEINDYKNSLLYFQKNVHLKDSLEILADKELILDLQTKYESEKKELENRNLKIENENNNSIIKNQRTISISISILLLMMALLAYVIYRSRSRIKDVNSQLHKLNDKVLKQNKQLEETNLTKDKLFSVIAHDLRSPFNSMLGLLKYMIVEPDDIEEEQRKEIFVSLYKQTTNTYGLLENLLQWSMAQRGKFEFNPQKLNLLSLIEGQVDFLRSRLEKKKIQLKNKVSQSCHIMGDKETIIIIIRNIINNAIKFTPQDGRIEVDCTHDNDRVIISVKDNGVGMAEEKVNQLLTKSNFDSTHGTDNEIGSGLGLVIVKDFIVLNKATLSIKSEEGEGTTFCINFVASNNTIDLSE